MKFVKRYNIFEVWCEYKPNDIDMWSLLLLRKDALCVSNAKVTICVYVYNEC